MLDHQGRLAQDQALDFALQILAGLEAAHAIGVVHRDLKPDNVFVTPSGGGPLLKLIDFGIAKLRASSEYTKGLTRAGVIMGTPEYMAPEQLYSAHTTDLRADIYSLGVMLFEMLSGVRPADGEDADHIIALVEAGKVRHLAEVAPGVPLGLVQLIERAMAPSRDARFASAAELRLALAPFAGQLSHAGRLAAIAPPLEVVSRPPATGLSSFPAPVAAVPKTLPPDEPSPPLSVSQLGVAGTSLSEGEPQAARRTAAATAPGGDPPYAAKPYPQLSAQAPSQPGARPRRGRSVALLFGAVVAVLGGGGAIGYAAYRAADNQRMRPPPLPEVTLPATPGTPTVETLDPLNPDVTPSAPVGDGAAQGPRPTRPTTSPPNTSGTDGTSATTPGGITPVDTSKAPPFQIPFPLPSGVALPTAFPSGIQLPPGFPGFPGAPQTTATSTPPSAPTTPVPAPAPTPAPTGTRKRPSTGTKP
jgi:serine/threonine-protein kinase